MERVVFLGLSRDGERRLECARDLDRSRDFDRLLDLSLDDDLRRERSLLSDLSLGSFALSFETDLVLLVFFSDLRIDRLCSCLSSLSFDADLLLDDLDFLSESRLDSRLLLFERLELLSSRFLFLLLCFLSSSPLFVLINKTNNCL